MAHKEHPRYAEMEWDPWEFREYPMMVYPDAKDQSKPYDDQGKVLPGVKVNDDDEFEKVMGFRPGQGPKPEPTEAPQANTAPGGAVLEPTASPGVSRVQSEQDRHTQLYEKAVGMGLKVDRKWSEARLQMVIDEASPAPAEV